MDLFFRFCCYVMAAFTLSIAMHYVLNYLYPPICNGCKASGGAKTFWDNLEHKKPKKKQEEEDTIDEDI